MTKNLKAFFPSVKNNNGDNNKTNTSLNLSVPYNKATS